MAFYKSPASGQRLLLPFGGQKRGTDKDKLGKAKNSILAVDMDARTWWKVDLAGGAVVARVEARLVVVGEQVFLFGGKTYDKDSGRHAAEESYCVASLRGQQWAWEVRDAPYPEHVPALGHCCDAVVMRGEETPTILLTAGITGGGADDVAGSVSMLVR
ncbi:hypothetical protein B0H15DRAFT_655586 [Mycena belliarum]|uniref:Uncharacterized protein n=1 Tax=Mycena belliarum TaxID=1033014 RepID=A0AAD6XJA3_9AGAR|nr:hypothetical protein B0H15DRAFT_655586 [Mycena belliae]